MSGNNLTVITDVFLYSWWFRYVLQVARTLMITSIPREISDPGLITKHFQ